MSSESLVEGPDGVAAAWETNGQVFFGNVTGDGPKVSTPIPAPGAAPNRKHPSLAINRRGETLLAWTEGTAWQRGGALAWQLYDEKGRPEAESGRNPDGIPAWSVPAAVALSDGSFLILH